MGIVQNPQANREALRRAEEERLRLAAMVASGRVATGRSVETTLTMPKNASGSPERYFEKYRSLAGGAKNETADILKAREEAFYARNYIQNNAASYDAEQGPGAAVLMLDYIDKSLADLTAFERRRMLTGIEEQRAESQNLYGIQKRRNEALEKKAFEKKVQTLPQGLYRGPVRAKAEDPETVNMAIRRLLESPANKEIDPYDSYRNADDFEEKSNQGAQMKNPSPAAFGQGFNVFGWKPFAQPVQNKVQYAKENADFLRMAALQGSSDPEMAYVKYAYLTDDETNLYNYLLAEHGEEEADRYLSEMDRELDRREAETFTQGAAEFASTNPVAANLLSAAASPLTGAGYAKNAFAEITGGAANPFDSSLGLSRISGAIRGRTAENISKGWAGGTGAFLYQTGMSMVDNLANMALFSGFGNAATLASMGSGAAENSYIDALDRGATSKQALGVGALSGAAEILFEKISLDHFIKLAEGGGAGAFVMNILKQVGIEASEETATEIANTVADTLVMGELSNYNLSVQRYMAEGKTKEEAHKQARIDVAKNVGLSALGGGLSGGVMGAGGGAIGAFRGSRAQNEWQDTSPRVDTALEEDGLVDDPLRQAADKAAGVAAPLQELQTEPVLPPEASRQGAADELDDTPKTEAKPPNMQEQQLGVVAKTLDPKTAQAYRSNYEGDMPVSQYSEGFMSVYGAAKHGLDFESSAAQSKYSISPVAAMAAFNAGQQETRGSVRENAGELPTSYLDADFRADEHTAQEVQSMEEFKAAVDPKLLQAAEMYRENKDAKNVRVPISKADAKEAGDIRRLTGLNVEGYTHTADRSFFTHVERRHGTNGQQDRSMQNLNDVARVGWVLQNYDSVEVVRNEDGTPVLSRMYRDKNDKPVPLLRFTKTVNGHVNVVEAIGDNKWKKIWLTSAYIAKNKKSVTQTPHAVASRQITPEAVSASPDHNIVPQATKKSNDTGNESTPGLYRRYTPEAMARLGGKEKQRTVRTQLRVLDAMAKEYGFAVDVVDTLGKQNAQYDPKTKRITIALDAQEGAYLHMAVHELTHYIRDNSGAEWEMFSDIVTDALLTQGVDVDALVQYQMKKNHLDADAALEEVVANSIPSILSDEGVIQRIVQTDRTLAQRIADFFRDFVAKIKDIGTRLGQSRSWVQMNWLHNDGKALQDIADQFFASLESAGEVQSGKGTGHVKNASKERGGHWNGLDGYTEHEIENWATSKRIEVALSSEQVVEFVANALNNKQENKKLYLGKIADSVAARIQEKTGLDVRRYNLALQSDEVRKIFESHGREDTESPRGQRAITPGDFTQIADIVNDPDDIVHVSSYNGHPAIQFKKTMNGKTTLITYTARKHHDLVIQTMYASKQKKGDLSTPSDARDFSRPQTSTPETSRGRVSFKNSIASETEQSQADDNRTAKYSAKDDTEIDAAVLARFGKTYNWKETGYLMKDGTKLDFSGRNEGGPGGYRAVDHREVYGEHTQEYTGELDGYSDSMIDYMARGNIRMIPESDGFNLSVAPTAKQEAALRQYIERVRGEVMVDIDAPNGDTVESVEYPRGTHAEKVLTDIRRYFADGTKPVVSDIARARAMSDDDLRLPQAKYSTKDLTSDDVQALVDENGNYQKTIDLMQERYDLLRAEFKTTEGHRVRQKDVDQLAKRILKKERSSADEAKTANGLGKVFDYLASDSPQWDQLAAMGTSWAKGVLEKSAAVDREAYHAMAGVRETLRDLRVSLSDAQKAEAKSRMGSDRAYRNALFGYVTLASDGMPLSSAWGELAERFPHVFSADISEADMPMQLLDAVEASRPHYINPYEMSMDEAAYDLFMQAYDQYFDLPEVKTFADRQKAKLDLLRMQSRNAMDRIRRESKERYDRQLSALRKENVRKRQELAAKYQEAKERSHREDLAKYRARYRALTDQKNQKLMEQRARFAEWRTLDSAKRKERDAVRKYRSRIEKNALELAAWLEKPTHKKHVPEALRESVVSFLEGLNFDAGTKRSENLKNRLSAMARKLEKMDKGDYDGFYPVIDPDTIAALDGLSEQVKSTQSVYDMSGAQLKELSEAVISVRRAVQEANKLHGANRYETVSAAGDAAIAYMENRRDKIASGKVGEMVSGLLNADMLDSFAYFRRFGEAGNSMLQSLRDGFDRKVEHIREAQEYAQSAIAEVDLKKLSGKKATTHTFTLAGGTLEMTTAQIMGLYELSKRGQAQGHLYGGGISLDEKSARVTKVTEADVRQICDVLTEEEKALADKLQGFLAKECARWGNEASLTLYGYRKFTEENYYPIHSNDNFTKTKDSADEKGSLQRLQNLGMTKATVAGATNPLMVADIFDTFSRHVQDMADYNAYAAPASDLLRWYNYRQKDGGAVKQEMERVYGRQGKQWMMNFVKDLNGVTEGRYGSGIVQSMMRNVKVAAVGANLRVVIQQPTAYARAFAEMDAKYLLKGLAHKPNIQLAKKYCPITQWKSWGYYETGLGKSLRETLVGDQSAMEALREKSTALAGVADEVTWGALWNAAAAETKDTHTELAQGTEAFYQAVGKRLSEVIDRTQVVDSVFHRTQIMRSKDGFAQLTTAFMSEPMKTYNMVRTAIAEAALSPGKETGARLGRVALTYAFTGALTAAAAAVADAFRDDDDEKEWMEKWRDAFGGNVLDNLNPLQMIPIARDALSLFEGYQPGRLDQQGITRMVNVLRQQLKMMNGESKWSNYKMAYEAVRAVSDLTGIPLGSLMREFNTAYATITGKPIEMEHETASLEIAAQNLYDAIRSGDKEKEARIRNKLLTRTENPKTNAEIDAAIAKKLMEDDSRIRQAWEAKNEGNATKVSKLRKEIIREGYTGEMVDKAVALYGATQEEKAEKDMEKELSARLYKTEDLVAAAKAAAKTGSYTNMDMILAELIEDSGAKDPESAVRESVRTALKPEYMQAVRDGRTGEVNRLGAVLKDRLGATDKSLETWVQDDRRERLRTAIEVENAEEALAVVFEMQDAGKKDSDIASSLKSSYQDAMYEAWSQGEDDVFFKYVDQLASLPLYNAKHEQIFTVTSLMQLMRDMEEKELEAEIAG